MTFSLSRQGTGDDSEDEEDEQEALRTVESRLLEHDPKFTLDDTAERQAMRKHQLLNAFIRGLAPDDPLDTYDPESAEHNSQLHMNVERARVPEVIWQPHMAGLDQAGLAEIVEHVLRGFGEPERQRLTQVRTLDVLFRSLHTKADDAIRNPLGRTSLSRAATPWSRISMPVSARLSNPRSPSVIR